MIYLYHLISIFAAVIVAPCFALYSLFSRNKWRRLKDHFGAAPARGCLPENEGQEGSNKTIWIHALSLGEVVAATPSLRRLREMRSRDRIVLSVTTDSGYEAAKRKLPNLDALFFHPLDCLPFTWMTVRNIRPDLFVLVDTGFWPGLLHLLHLHGVPVFLFNGRISSRSMRRYKIFGAFFSRMFNRFKLLCMQNPYSRDALESMGVDESRLMVIGDPKYDALPASSPEKRDRIRKRLRIAPLASVWVAGSTHEGEEETVLDVHRSLRKRFGNLVLVLAPRRQERTPHVARLIMAKGLSFVRRSDQWDKPGYDYAVLLLDTMGELAEVYSICDLAFVGRSLLPPGGGHNLIEPVARGKPVLFGPHVENNRHTAEELIESGLGTQVKNAEEMETAVDRLLSDKTERARLEGKARGFILHHQGASRRMAEIIDKQLEE